MDFNVKSMPCRMHKSSWLRKSLNIMRCIVLFIGNYISLYSEVPVYLFAN